jgi:hypothetical protein
MTRVAQVGGSHYKARGLQHWDVMEVFDVGYLEGQATKYIVRFDKKGTPVEDLKKAVSYVDRLLAGRDEVRRRVPGVILDQFYRDNELSEEKRNLLTLILYTGTKLDLSNSIVLMRHMIADVIADQEGLP